MSLFPQSALRDGVKKREVFGWAMYDFANSGYTTVVLTAVFGAYFVSVVAGGASWATLAWTFSVALSSAIVMLTMPLIGAYADLKAAKKKLLALSTLLCVFSTAGLALVSQGDVGLAITVVVLSNTFYSYGESLIASFLPELAREEGMGRVSGWGWSFGYLGGMLALGIGLAYVTYAQARGDSATSFVPVVMLMTAVFYGAASLATFALLKERAAPQMSLTVLSGARGWRASLERLANTWNHAARYADFRAFMACCAAYQAGISTVITLAAIYAEQTLGFKQAETMLLVFLVNIAAVVGAFSLGYLQDRIGHKQALAVTLAAWVVMTLLAAMATRPALFWAAAVIAGLCMGSSQSAGRAMVGLLAPPDRHAEFFALWTFATRFAGIVGPLTYGVIVWLTGSNHRLAILSTGLFFLVGLWLLKFVDIKRGQLASSLNHPRNGS